MITDINQLDFEKSYTYADYLTWKFSERVELFKGRIFKMSAPSRQHQKMSLVIERKIDGFLSKNKATCELYHAPFDVRLPLPAHKIKGDKVDTVVQPDICVVFDLSKLDDSGCNGSPDLIIEILSPENSKKEMRDKFELYESAGVLEYWIVEPYKEYIIRYNLNKEGKYQGSPPMMEGMIITSEVLKGLEIDVTSLFDNL
jgi:Uma2 family endonuclease